MTVQLASHLDADRQRAVENVRAAAARFWQRPAHRHLIDHGLAHTARVIALLDGLTEGLMARADDRLSPDEITILLAAAHLHALGLQDEQCEPDPAARLARYPELGTELIYRALESPEEAANLGLPDDPGLVEMIALVVAGHRQTEYPSPQYDDFPLGNATVRPRLLAALLCLADGLDLDYRRINLEQIKLMSLAPDEALDWWLHHYVSGVQVVDEYVRIGYRLPQDAPGYDALLPRLVEARLRADFDVLRDTFRLYGVKPDIAPPTSLRPMRAVQPMPPPMWAEAQRRLARLNGEIPAAPLVSPLVETVRGLLQTMGYDCGLVGDPENGLTHFRCEPLGGGLRSAIWVGCKDGPAEVTDVQALGALLEESCRQGYVVAETRVLDSARQAADDDGRVKALTLAGFYRELLDFSLYVKQVVDDYQGSELARYYVDLGCVRYSYDARGEVVGEDRCKPLDDYLDAWLRAGGERNHISILGDYGTGKTSFCRQYAAKQGRRWLADPDRERIPVLINLRDYTKTLEVGNLITGALINQYGIRGATFDAFMRYNQDGKLLILFDGFDEMAQRTGLRTAVDNFWELARVVTPGSKVVLTCRTPYFRTHHEAERLLHGILPSPEVGRVAGGEGGDFIDLRDRPNFEIVHLEPFDDVDVQAVLRRRFPDRWRGYWEQVQRIYNLPDLAHRPVLLDMIAKTLPELKEGQRVNAARLYRVYTDLWLEREVAKGRTLISPDDRRFFAEALAMEMLRSGELNVHYSRFPARVSAQFELKDAAQIDYFESDVRTCNFMSRDEDGHYQFAHKSFMEFFCACHLHRLMLEDKATANGPVSINEEVRLFLTDLFAEQPKAEPGPPVDPPDGFVWVPSGEYIIGAEGELPLQVARLEQGFFAARAPVTNAQYARFIEAGGYRQRKYWTDEGWQWREKEKRTQPGYWNHSEYNNSCQPVVGVTWYEVMAFCAWQTEQMDGWVARLPTEQEWEKAARGVDGREYPWGEWAEGRCNTDEAKIGRPTPVGQFSPEGDSPYGLQDVAGNVWEWTTSQWAANDPDRVLRGGSFYLDLDLARCSCRLRGTPDLAWDHDGIRVVVSPIPPP